MTKVLNRVAESLRKAYKANPLLRPETIAGRLRMPVGYLLKLQHGKVEPTGNEIERIEWEVQMLVPQRSQGGLATIVDRGETRKRNEAIQSRLNS